MLKDCLHDEYGTSGICFTCSPPEGWTEHASCSNPELNSGDLNLCFPEEEDARQYEMARAMCLNCPVRAFCLEVGIKDKEGMWGAYTPSERRKLVASTRFPKDRLKRRAWIRAHFHEIKAD